MYESVNTVFLDAAGTLFSVRGSVGQIYTRQARMYGIGSEEQIDWVRLEEKFAQVFAARDPMLFPGVRTRDLPTLERHWWEGLVKQTFGDLAHGPRFNEFFHALYDLFGTAAPWKLEPGCEQLLRELNGRGFRLAVISNFDSRLPAILSALGILGGLERVFVSSILGIAKPDPRIFQFALKEMKAGAGECIHVGDNPRDDLLGATGAGIEAVLYDPQGRTTQPPHRTVRKLPELLSLLPKRR